MRTVTGDSIPAGRDAGQPQSSNSDALRSTHPGYPGARVFALTMTKGNLPSRFQ